MLKRRSRIVLLSLVIAPICIGCSPALTRPDERLRARLDAVLDRLSETGAVVHARVIELPSGREWYTRNSDTPCTPASNFKLLTSAAGLDMFGPDHRVKTYLAMDGDDLWLIGTGDPATGDPRLARAADRTPLSMLDDWADALERRGITAIRGDLVYDDSAFEREPRIHPTWPRSWSRYWYGAPTAGLNFNDNCVDITIEPTQDGQPVRYEVMPPVENIQIINACISRVPAAADAGGSTGGDASADVAGPPSITMRDGGNVYEIRGICTRRTELASKPVEDPGAFFADALRTHLAKRGITIAGRIRRAESPLGGAIPPPADKVIAVHETPLSDILARINKNSQNLFAECLCKLTGQAYEARRGRRVPGSWENGGQALRAFLRANGIDDSGLVPVDGSGLSPENRLTARMLTDVLRLMFTRHDAAAYRASLAVAGVDGSLRDRMRDLKGRVLGKTGYIGGVASLSGYIQTHDDRWLAFAIVYNGLPSTLGDSRDTRPYTALADEACRILYHWPHDPPQTQPADEPAE